MVSDGKVRTVHYSIIEDGGFASMGQGVEWCVIGLDRNWAYNPGCNRPALSVSWPDFGRYADSRLPSFVLEMFRCLLGSDSGGLRVGVMRWVSRAADSALLVCRWLILLAGWTAGGGTRPTAERARRIRFLCAFAVMVAVVLRGRGGARQYQPVAAGPVRRAAVLLCGARPLAAIRARLSRILPASGAAARSPHHDRRCWI